MKTYDHARRINHAAAKMLSIAFLFVAAFLFSTLQASAETALTVQYDGVTKKAFSYAELQQIAASEGDRSYDYSAFNTGSPTFELVQYVRGVTLIGLLSDAGIDDSMIGDTDLIDITSGDGYHVAMTGKQFHETRYCYPDAGEQVNWQTGNVSSAAYEGRTEVPLLIELTTNEELQRFLAGQVAPNEQNQELFAKKMLQGGVINVTTETAPVTKGIDYVSPGGGTRVPVDGEIAFSRQEDINSSTSNRYEKIYYTTDGTDPDYGSAVYNYNMNYPDPVCKPVLDTTGRITLKVRVMGYGKQDSEVQTFTFNVIDKILSIRINGENIKTYNSVTDLTDISKIRKYSYSGYSTYPTFHLRKNIQGVLLADVLNDALSGNGMSLDDISDNTLIKIIGGDTTGTSLTKKQLFGTDRYYYPNAGKASTTGGATPAGATDGAKAVSAIIQTGFVGNEEENDYTCFFGQAFPEDQNYAECMKYILRGGVIDICTDEEAEQLSPITGADPASGSTISYGTAIEFDRDVSTERNKRNKIYYLIDDNSDRDPGPGDSIYNYASYAERYVLSNPPILKSYGTHTIKVKVTGYGALDSDTTTFTYTVKPSAPAAPKATPVSYSSIKLTWSKCSGATGYKIYRNGSTTPIKTITDGSTLSYTNTGVATGTQYRYTISAIRNTWDGKKIDSYQSKSAYATAKLKTPVAKLYPGRKQVKVTWGKVSGASGYKIYRSTKKSSGYKLVKTITRGSTVSYTNKYLKARKYYYYKVRAYRTVSGKKVYSSYSYVKSAKTK